jgi:hypothetical protein
VPGRRALVAALLSGGEKVCRGWPAEGEAPDELSLFEVGSIPEALTGVLVADMARRGEVTPDDPR